MVTRAAQFDTLATESLTKAIAGLAKINIKALKVFDIRALDLHPLRGGRRGQYAMRLTGAVRLVITRDAAGPSVTVEEVTDYHG